MRRARGGGGGDEESPLVLAIAQGLARALARLAPRARRAELRREWQAELVGWWRERRGRGETGVASRARLLARAALVLGDAWTLRRLDRERARASRARAPGPRARKETAMRDLLFDLLVAARSLRRRPTLAVLCVLTLALGIGATTVVTSVAWGLVYRPLDYPEPEELVDVWPELWWSKDLFARLRTEAKSFERVALWTESSHRLVGEEGGTLLLGPEASAGFVEVLGGRIVAGRPLEPRDERPGSDVVVLTSEGLRRLGLSPEAAVGRSLDLDGRRLEIVGVLAPSLDVLQRDAEVVRPTELAPLGRDWTDRYLHVVARLREGVTIEAARAELVDLARRWSADLNWSEQTIADADVVPLQAALGRGARSAMLLLLGAVACMLLLASANVANLLLARALEREREMRTRAALGAGASRLLRQAWAESALLALAGGALGVLAARLALPVVVGLLPRDTPHLDRVAFDGATLLASCATTLAVALLVGLAPAWHALRPDLRAAAIGVTSAGSRSRARGALVVCEVALAVLLTVAAGLLAKSFVRTMRTDLGLRAGGLLTFLLVPEAERFGSAAQLVAYYDELRLRLASLPGVRGVAEAHALPVQNPGWTLDIHPQGEPPGAGEPRRFASWRPVTERYFELLGIPVLEGRTFDAGDAARVSPVGVLNRSGASRLLGEGDPIGRRVAMAWDTAEPIEIVGVVEDVKVAGAREEVPITLYRPYAQAAAKTHAMSLAWRSVVLRVDGDPRRLERQVREEVRAFDPRAAIDRMTTMESVVAEDRAEPRLLLVLVGMFAGAGVLLGAIGVYGVLECLVRDRRRELAIRAALGASRRAVRGLVLRRSLALAAGGIACGALLAVLAGRLLEGLLFEVSARDPAIFALAIAGALGIALLAAWWPARRAGGTDPGGLLRGD
jgi:predicted permease